MENTAHENIEHNKRNRPGSRLAWLVAGIILGIVLFVAVRTATAKNPYTHYHANFAIYINGQAEKFEGPGFYEEVAACNVHNADDLKSRVHMHDNVAHAVHVHDTGVSWGDFFSNIGYTVGSSVLSDGSNTFVNGQDSKKLSYLLNGKPVSDISSTVIKSEDVLLIDYGDDTDQQMQKHFESIPRDAHHLNVTKDPSACSGNSNFDLKARLKQALGMV